jgi:serine/threonine-protein kinase
VAPGEPSQGNEEALRPSLAGVVLDQRYILEEQIGAGGLGEIYRARHVRMQRTFAVKLLPAEMLTRPDFVERFDREAQALSRLNHPCCVSVTDYGISETHGPFIVMELCEGTPLSTYTHDEGLALGAAIDLMIAVLAGLEHAHAQGIVHRDIKPDNIMVVPRPLEPERLMPKILDFGFAKIRSGFAGSDDTVTEAGFVAGTPHYLAPERVGDLRAGDDPRADVYSAGVVLYELCCGRRPFVHDDPLQVIHMHVLRPPPPPRFVRPSLPEALEQVILRALEKKPADRFSSAAAFRQALQELPPLPERLAAQRPDDTCTTPPPAAVESATPTPGARIEAATLLEMVRPPAAAPRPLWRRPVVLAGAAAGALALIALVLALALIRRPQAPAELAPEPPPAVPLAAAKPATAPRAAAQPTAGPLAAAGAALAPASAPVPAATPTLMPPELRQTASRWSEPRTRAAAARRIRRWLAQHPDDAAAHVAVGRLFLFGAASEEGLRLVQRGVQADPALRLDFETLVAVAFACHGATAEPARQLIDAHAGAAATTVVLVAAAGAPSAEIRRTLLADARRRGPGADPLDRRLLALVEARSCAEQRGALRELGAAEAPSVRLLLALLESNGCLARDAQRLLAGRR